MLLSSNEQQTGQFVDCARSLRTGSKIQYKQAKQFQHVRRTARSVCCQTQRGQHGRHSQSRQCPLPESRVLRRHTSGTCPCQQGPQGCGHCKPAHGALGQGQCCLITRAQDMIVTVHGLAGQAYVIPGNHLALLQEPGAAAAFCERCVAAKGPAQRQTAQRAHKLTQPSRVVALQAS